MHRAAFFELYVAVLVAALIPATLQQDFSSLITQNFTQLKVNGTIKIAFVFTVSDLPNPKLCMVEKFYKQLAAATTQTATSCYNNLVTNYWSVPTPVRFDYIGNLLAEIKNFEPTIMVGSNNFIVNDIASILGIPNFQIYQLPLSSWAAHGKTTIDLLSLTIRQLSDTSYFQFINNMFYYIAVGSQSNAVYKSVSPMYGPQSILSYTTYHDSRAQQEAIQSSILQYNALPYNGSIVLLYDVSLDYSFTAALLNSWSNRYRTDRRFYLKMVDITFAATRNQDTLVGIVNNIINSSNMNVLIMVYTTLSTSKALLNVINSGYLLSTTSTGKQIYWNFINITLLTDLNLPIQALIFHWEFVQKSYQQILSDGLCTAQTATNTLWHCLLDYDFASWLFQASQTDCAAELKAPNTTTPQQYYNLLKTAFASTTIYGYTGKANYHNTGARLSFTTSMHLGIARSDQTTTTCNYTQVNTSSNFIENCTKPVMPLVQATSGPRQVTVVTYDLPPFYYVQNGVQRGINVEMTNQIARILNLNATIVAVDTIGTQDPITLKWSGLVGQLVYQQADFAVAALPVTAAYDTVVQYSSIYLEEQWSMLMARPGMVTFVEGILRIFAPYDSTAWIIIVAAIAISTAVLTALDYMVPNSIAFDVSRSFYFTTGRAIQGMAGASPDAGSSRILVIYWSFNCLVVMQSYVANMAALLLYSQQVKTSITSPMSILTNNYIPAGMANSPSANYFATTSLYEDSLLWTKGMSSNLITTASQILSKLNNGSFVYIGQLDTNNYLAQNNPCYNSISSFGGETYALATPIGINQVTIQELNSALQQMSASGVLQSIIANNTQVFSTKATSTCNANVSWTLVFGESETTILDTVKMSGLFLIMCFGCAVALLMAIGERFAEAISKQRKALAVKLQAKQKAKTTKSSIEE